MYFKNHFLVFATCLIFIFQKVNAQSLEFFSGANYNYNVPINIKSTGIHRQESSNSLKLNFGIALDSVKISTKYYRFSLQLVSQNGNIIVNSSNYDLNNYRRFDYSRHFILLSGYFLNYHKGNLQLNGGLYTTIQVKQKSKVTLKYYNENQEIIEYSIPYSNEDNRYGIFPYFNLGLSGRIAYDLKICKNIFLTPQYTFAVGFFPDPYSIPIRQFANLGLKYKFPPKKTAKKPVQKK